MLHGQLFSLLDTDMAGICFDTVNCCMRKGNGFIKGTVFQNQQSGHKLGDAGRIHTLFSVFAEQNGSGAGVHEKSCFRLERRSLRPLGKRRG